MGGEFGGEWIHVYVWLSPFAIYLIANQLHHNKKKKKKTPQKTGQKQDTVTPITLGEKKQKNGKYTSLQYNDFLWKKKAVFKASVFKKTYK